jgi:putative transposase
MPLHVIQRGNNRAAIFGGTDDLRFFRRMLAWNAARHGLAIHAYVFMPNHFHLLATPENAATLPKLMQALGRVYVQYFNRANQRTGTLWEGRYRCTVVDDERYLFACMRYIELNPVRGNMVARPDSYAWSSYRANASGAADELTRPHSLYTALGRSARARQAAYRGMFADAIPQEQLQAIRDATHNAWALGDARFKQRVSGLGRRAERLPLGRPREPSEGTEDKSSLTLLL